MRFAVITHFPRRTEWSARSRVQTTAAPPEGNIHCPICTSGGVRIFQRHGYWIRECSCGHRFADLEPAEDHVEAVYSDEYFLSGGDGYPDYTAEAHLITKHGRFYGKLLRRYTQPGDVLDVGSACGFILSGLRDYGWQGIGIEPNPTMVDYARQHGLEVYVATLEDFETDRRFDLINMTQVIAHFRDVRSALEVAGRLTKPNGYWLIETWDKDSWMARAQKEHWHEYSPPSVLQYFSKAGLKDLVEQFGPRLVSTGRPPKEISAFHVQSLARHKASSGAPYKLVGAMASLVPPTWALPYPSFDLFWSLFRMAR